MITVQQSQCLSATARICAPLKTMLYYAIQHGDNLTLYIYLNMRVSTTCILVELTGYWIGGENLTILGIGTAHALASILQNDGFGRKADVLFCFAKRLPVVVVGDTRV